MENNFVEELSFQRTERNALFIQKIIDRLGSDKLPKTSELISSHKISTQKMWDEIKEHIQNIFIDDNAEVVDRFIDALEREVKNHPKKTNLLESGEN